METEIKKYEADCFSVNVPVGIRELNHGPHLAGKSTRVGPMEGRTEGMSERQFVNYYRCPMDGEEWAEVWSCCCNDRCPKCGTKDIEPYRSLAVVHGRHKEESTGPDA